MRPAPTILFAGGGTGGHLFPSLAIAECLLEQRPDARVVFLCSTRPGDSEMLRAERLAGHPVMFQPIAAQPFVLRPRGFLRFVRSWGGAVRAGRQAIVNARAQGGPVTVVAMGGFVAAPIVQAARVEGCRVVMVNLDATPGRANRWIARHADRVFTAAEVPGVPWQSVRPIVRQAARAPGTPQECRRLLGLSADRPTLFVTGASLGAQSINRFMIAFLAEHAQELRDGGWQVVHQTGRSDIDETRAAYELARLPARVETFFREMGVAWGAADLALSRSGAGSVAEAWSNRVPTLFLPYPFHADQHQKRNAAPLVAAGGSVLATDRVEPASNVREIGPVLSRLLGDETARAAMRSALAALGPADGALTLATALLSEG